MGYIYEIVILLLLGISCGVFLTLMDRVDEHELIIGKYKTIFAYFFGILSTFSFIISINLFQVLYPFIVGLFIEWIIKNKLEYPSHVFFLFLTTLYFGYRFELMEKYFIYILIYLILIFFIGSYLKYRINKNSKFHNLFYKTYFSKIFVNFIFFIFLLKPIGIFYSIGFTYSCLFIKKKFPGRNP